MARFSVTFQTPHESLSFHTGDLDPDARAAILAACVRLALASGWTLRLQRLPDSP